MRIKFSDADCGRTQQDSDGDRIPAHENVGGEQTLMVEPLAFRQALEDTYFFVARLDGHDSLYGLLLETEGEWLRAVATDGCRLALSKMRTEGPARSNGRGILPEDAVKAMRPLLDEKEDIELCLGTTRVLIRSGGERYAFAAIAARFPDYNRVVPRKFRNVLTADNMLLRQLLQRAATVCSGNRCGVRLELGTNRLEVRSIDAVPELVAEALEVEYGGKPIEIGFNVDYLLDALAAVEGDRVQFVLSDSRSGCLIRGLAAHNTQFVVMPMRLCGRGKAGSPGSRNDRLEHGHGETQ